MVSNTPSKPVVKYLPFDRFLVAAKIGELTPDALKKAATSAKEAYRGDKDFKQTTALNHIANSLGFKGFNGFKDEWEALENFMRTHGLEKQRDVLAVPGVDGPVSLTYRQVADRLFFSEKALPQKIFVGAGVRFNDLLAAAENDPEMKVVSNVFMVDSGISLDNAEAVRYSPSLPTFGFAILTREAKLGMTDLMSFRNLLGDQLCDPPSGDLVALLYNTDDRERHRLAGAARILTAILLRLPAGWVDVIPYNNRLAFLKAPDGGYEFVFRNMRSAPFSPGNAGRFRLWGDPARLNERQQFAIYRYFQYEGWEEADGHRAEQAYYGGGGQPHLYPGYEDILRDWLKRRGQFQPKNMNARSVVSYPDVRTGERTLRITELITVAEFRKFMKADERYAASRGNVRGIEPWEPANHPNDGHLPAAVAWDDAEAYARWKRQIDELPWRLATEAEYLALAEGLAPERPSPEELAEAFARPLGNFHEPDGTPVGPRPAAFKSDFDLWEYRYDPSAVVWDYSLTDMKILRSAWFGEWLEPKGAAINGMFLCSQAAIGSAAYMRVAAARDRFAPFSTGKYKSMKIGFRLVRDIDGSV